MKYYKEFSWSFKTNENKNQLYECLSEARKKASEKLGKDLEARIFHSIIWHHDYEDFSTKIPFFIYK